MTLRSAFFRAGILAAAVSVIAGCGQPHKVHPQPFCDFRAVQKPADVAGPVLVPMVPGALTPMPLNAVTITDAAISNKIMVQATNARRMPGGDIEVFARLVNCTDFPLQVEARTPFFDATQTGAEAPSAWKRMYMAAHTIANYSLSSTAGEAVASYLVEVREGR